MYMAWAPAASGCSRRMASIWVRSNRPKLPPVARGEMTAKPSTSLEKNRFTTKGAHMKKKFWIVTVSLGITWLAGSGSAQQNPVPLATTGLVSPEVHADRTVTFRLEAPKASKVEIAGEWISTNRAETTTDGSVMKKD